MNTEQIINNLQIETAALKTRLKNTEIKCESLQLQLDQLKDLATASLNPGQGSQPSESTAVTYKTLFGKEANASIVANIINFSSYGNQLLTALFYFF
jgi:hypothetical protein